MQELEKILEEIDVKIAGSMGRKREGLLEAQEIIRKHMNDNNPCGECSRRKWYQIGYKDGMKNSWIPVEEGLPEKEYYTALCITDKNHYCVAVYNKKYGFRTGDIDVEGEVIAWRPLPEPYSPERSIK